MKLKRFLLRYYPPGIILEYEKGGFLRTKSIDLLDLTPECVSYELVEEIRQSEPLVTKAQADQVKQLVIRLQKKQTQQDHHRFCFSKELKAHILPLTNVAFDKSGSSYDRTCRVWDTASGQSCTLLEGHRTENLYNMGGLRLALFDKTCKLWCAETGKFFHTYRGHMEKYTLVATSSMDTTAKLWDVKIISCISHTVVVGKYLHFMMHFFIHPLHVSDNAISFQGHTAEVLSLCFNTVGSQLVTGSFDHTVTIWDTGHTLIGHMGEISNTHQFN
uniref:Uncharacterized protein n=1 Tax=Maylandia zebra TaxID=106582 RepID=A0A3P9BJ95_9CICH